MNWKKISSLEQQAYCIRDNTERMLQREVCRLHIHNPPLHRDANNIHFSQMRVG
jgi:hypothetical protein